MNDDNESGMFFLGRQDRLPAATRWNYHSRVIDQFHRRLGLAAPSQPSLTNLFPAPVSLPVELVSTPYQTTTAEMLNSSWFQVAADDAFANLKVDRIRDVENLHGDTGAPLYESIDRHAGLNLLRYAITTGLADGKFYARVRHRDANAQWSPWSATVNCLRVHGFAHHHRRGGLHREVQ